VENNGATLGVGSDCYPYTILTRSDRKITAQRDNFRAGEGHEYFGNQVWDITPNPDATIETFTLRKNGRWIRVGDSKNGCALYPGHKRAYRDPSF
jgi:predicted Abi (CAAX) family protease